MTKCIIFDFDGVLVDSIKIKRDAYFEIFEAFGEKALEVVESVLETEYAADRYQVIETTLLSLDDSERTGNSRRTQELVKRYGSICEQRVSVCPEMVGALDVISSLSELYPLYVNSATPEDSLRRLIAKRSWADYFEGVLGSPRRKIQNLLKILKHQNIQGNEALFVGDSQADWDAAAHTGCCFLAMVNDTDRFSSLQPYRIQELPELLDLLEDPKRPSGMGVLR